MSESERDFEEIINKLLIHIPEDNKLMNLFQTLQKK